MVGIDGWIAGFVGLVVLSFERFEGPGVWATEGPEDCHLACISNTLIEGAKRVEDVLCWF